MSEVALQKGIEEDRVKINMSTDEALRLYWALDTQATADLRDKLKKVLGKTGSKS